MNKYLPHDKEPSSFVDLDQYREGESVSTPMTLSNMKIKKKIKVHPCFKYQERKYVMRILKWAIYTIIRTTDTGAWYPRILLSKSVRIVNKGESNWRYCTDK